MKFTAVFAAILSAASLASAAALPAEMQAVESRGRTVSGGDVSGGISFSIVRTCKLTMLTWGAHR